MHAFKIYLCMHWKYFVACMQTVYCSTCTNIFQVLTFWCMYARIDNILMHACRILLHICVNGCIHYILMHAWMNVCKFHQISPYYFGETRNHASMHARMHFCMHGKYWLACMENIHLHACMENIHIYARTNAFLRARILKQ